MYLKYKIWGRGNLYKSSHDWFFNGEIKFCLFCVFFSWKLVTRTHHVSARMCFGSLRLTLTDQLHGVSCTCRGRGRDGCTSALHDAEFVCLVSKLTPSALDRERQDFLNVQNKEYVVWERNDDVAINVSICCQYKMIICTPVSSFSSPNTGKTQTKWSEFSEGPRRSSGAGALALWGGWRIWAEQVRRRADTRGPKSSLPSVCRDRVEETLHSGAWLGMRQAGIAWTRSVQAG